MLYDAGNQGEDEQSYWDIALDQDLLETILNLYPEWFTGIMADEEALLLQLQEAASVSEHSGLGSPQAIVDEASIQKAMDRNKESLKVKLLLRRPINQLVEQGILPRKLPLISYDFYS